MPALRRAVAEEPGKADARAWLGRAYLSQHNAEAAETEFRSAVDRDPYNQTALVGLGEIRFAQQRWVEAVQDFEDSRTWQPETLLKLGLAYLRLGKKEKARVVAEVLRAFAPEDPRAASALDDFLKP